ncbi:MAG TPA: uroporphyrinogen-III C-methyltransferase [Burkholderiaceae bacterium]
MNELPPPSDPVVIPASVTPAADAAGSFPPGSAPQPRRGLHPLQKPLIIALGVLLLLLLLVWWNGQREIRALRVELANRLRTLDTTATETRVFARSAQDVSSQLQAKVSVLESRQSEAQTQQLALEQLYKDLSKNRDDWALSEIEQVLSTASQQLQLAGNVEGALIALANADRALSRSDKPQFITIRRAIARDMDRLKALPSVDLTGIALRLDSVISQVDTLPLLSDEKPVVPATPPKLSRKFRLIKPNEPVVETSDWRSRAVDLWQSWSTEMWEEVRQLIRVRSVETPDALMMAPSQAYFARENVKLRLLNARLALLSRNEAAFRSDLIAAQDAIARYFDTRAKQTQTAQAFLKQVQGNELAIELPTLNESLQAVRNYKATP